jgi:hypothetical protein
METGGKALTLGQATGWINGAIWHLKIEGFCE